VSLSRPAHSHVRPLRGRETKLSRDWIMRPVFGLLLAGIAVEADYAGPQYFALFIGVGAMLAVREWHRMVAVGTRSVLPETILAGLSIVLALAALTLRPHAWYGWAIVGSGAVLVMALAALRSELPLWQGAGVLYIGAPALALLASRAIPPEGATILIGLFLIVWMTDTGALIAGNLLKGPKLAPVLSPNKTWSGTFGGILAAAAAEAIFIGVLGGSAWRAALYGAGLSVVAQAGDLFESFVKRRFHKKDSGTIIPGHGGVLDRIDSMLAAGVGVAVLVLALHADPLFGASP
jgi:phosphatidate cytidylyltransferase